jgi:hypothetical protein
MAIDVTSFLREHPDQELTFLIAREVRFDGENVDDDLTSLQLASKERGTEPGPQLLLSLSADALAGDYDRNGVVDEGDYDEWRRTFGSTSVAADGDGSGKVDAGDYLLWRKHLGMSLPGTTHAGASGTFPEGVPEPAGAVMIGIATLGGLRSRARRWFNWRGSARSSLGWCAHRRGGADLAC